MIKRKRQSWWLKNTRKGVSYYVRYVYVLGASTLFLCVPWAYNSCQNSEFADPEGHQAYSKLVQEHEAPEEPATPSAPTHYSSSSQFTISPRMNTWDIVFVVDVSCSMNQGGTTTAEKFSQAIQGESFQNFVQTLVDRDYDARIYLTGTLGHANSHPVVPFADRDYIQVTGDSDRAAIQSAQAQLQQAIQNLRTQACAAGLGGVANDCECGIKSAYQTRTHLRPQAESQWVAVVFTDEPDRCQQQGETECVSANDCAASGVDDLQQFKQQWLWHSVLERDEASQDRDPPCLLSEAYPNYKLVSQPEALWALGDIDWAQSLFEKLAHASLRRQPVMLSEGCYLYDNNFELQKEFTNADDVLYRRADGQLACADLPCWGGIDTSGFSFNRGGRAHLTWPHLLSPGKYKIYYHCQ